ncbi:MAG TPA: hypothetical protein VGE41_11335 [Verrucomicrobiae bacterium]
MVKQTKVLLAALALLLLSNLSCKKGVLPIVWNNAGTQVVLTTYDTKMAAIRFKIGNGQSAEVAWPTTVAITTKVAHWTYPPFPPLFWPYVLTNKFPADNIQIQIETNGVIFILSPMAKGICKAFPPQPKEFPYKPKLP